MSELIFAAQQGRKIPKEDVIFGINNRAKAMIAKEGKEKVTNATIGALLDDNGDLIVLSSVNEVFKSLSPVDFAEYAPIAGIPSFREAIKKDAFGKFEPKSFTEAVASPGGTGSLRNTIANFSEYGDKILTSDWHWSPYNTIAGEQGRSVDTFKLFNEKRKFNTEDFGRKVNELLETQERMVIILNTPAHNPTGYSMSLEDWANVKNVLENVPAGKKITLLVDIAYLDFAGEDEECRQFLPILDEMKPHILPILAHSLSKSYTLYGMRCGAMICMAKSPEVAEEFKRVCEYSSRASWSNCNRSGQVILSKIYADPELLKKVHAERAGFRDMLLSRGKAFEEAAKEADLEIVPFDGGFFTSVPCKEPAKISAELEKQGIFTVPLAKGIRVSVASISEEKCKMLPAKIKELL